MRADVSESLSITASFFPDEEKKKTTVRQDDKSESHLMPVHPVLEVLTSFRDPSLFPSLFFAFLSLFRRLIFLKRQKGKSCVSSSPTSFASKEISLQERRRRRSRERRRERERKRRGRCEVIGTRDSHTETLKGN